MSAAPAAAPDHRSSTSDEKLAKVSSKTHEGGAETVIVREAGADDSNVPSELPQGRQLGLISATFLMVNRIVGTGVFATTSTILAQSGSVGLSFIYWLIAAVIAATGYAVYAEFATALPRNGGELNYLQHAYRKPKYLVAAIFAAQALLLGQAAGNAYTSGAYFLRAGGNEVVDYTARGIGVVVLISALVIHGFFLKWGVRFLNIIGTFKIVVLLVIVFSGFAALAGKSKGPKHNNFSNSFEGSRSDIYGVASAIYNTIWSFVGYSNLYYATGEIKNPTRTIRLAGPLALGLITVIYLLVQVAYYAAVPKEELLASQQIAAAVYFKYMFGEKSARALSTFVALSATANVFSVIFAQGRLNQALGRDGIIPFSRFFASNRPRNAPLVGLTWHVIVTLIILLAPPRGDAYNFVLNLSSYPLNVVNFGVGLALVLAYLPRAYRPQWAKDWNPPVRATWPVAVFFTLVSLFLVVVPWIAPERPEEAVYVNTWYAIAPAVSVGIFVGGALYWLGWAIILPRIGNYKLVPRHDVLSDGTQVTVFDKVKRS